MFNGRAQSESHRPVGRDRERGLTLLEVMVALVILAIGLLALSGMQLMTIQKNGSSFRSTTAVSLADQRLQQLKNLSFSDPSLTAGSHTDTALTVTYGGATGSNVQHTYNRSYTVTDNSPLAGVKLVAYTVTWVETTTSQGLNGATLTVNHTVSLISRIGNASL